MEPAIGMPRAVLFDLDGTLIDSAPDLLDALDAALRGLGLPPCNHAMLREHVSRGAAGLIEAGVPRSIRAIEREAARQRLLDHYAANLWVRSSPFDGVPGLLEHLHGNGIRLGVVTNKIARFAEPVLTAAGWSGLFGCLVTGDRVERPKPDPEPVLTACRELGIAPRHTLFVGDDLRDVLAGRAAGAQTWVAAWGYVPAGARLEEWGADGVAGHPRDLIGRLIGSPETSRGG